MRRRIVSTVAGLFVAGAVLGLPDVAASQHIGSDMLVTESAVPVEEGRMDVEFGLTYVNAPAGKRGYYRGDWGMSRRALPGMDGDGQLFIYEWRLDARMGVAPDIEVGLSTAWVDMYDRFIGGTDGFYGGNHGRGLDDLEVYVKYRFLEEHGLSVAYIPGITIPTGRASVVNGEKLMDGRARFGPGQNYWSFDQRLAVTQDLEPVVVNADIGYSLPFGRTRRAYMRDFGEYTSLRTRDDNDDQLEYNKRLEYGVIDANVGALYAEGPVRPLMELNYAHRLVSKGSGSQIVHATIGGVVQLDENLPRVKVGYQHPVAGSNAARTRRFLLSMAYSF